MEGKSARIEQFLLETEVYIEKLEEAPKSLRFQPTYDRFKSDFKRLRANVRLDPNGRKKC